MNAWSEWQREISSSELVGLENDGLGRLWVAHCILGSNHLLLCQFCNVYFLGDLCSFYAQRHLSTWVHIQK